METNLFYILHAIKKEHVFFIDLGVEKFFDFINSEIIKGVLRTALKLDQLNTHRPKYFAFLLLMLLYNKLIRVIRINKHFMIHVCP